MKSIFRYSTQVYRALGFNPQYPRWTAKHGSNLLRQATTLKYSIGIVICETSEGGQRKIEDLLITLHKDLVTSTVKNDIGHKVSVEDPNINLKHLLYNSARPYTVTRDVKRGGIANWFTNLKTFFHVIKVRFKHNWNPSGNEMQLEMPCQRSVIGEEVGVVGEDGETGSGVDEVVVIPSDDHDDDIDDTHHVNPLLLFYRRCSSYFCSTAAVTSAAPVTSATAATTAPVTSTTAATTATELILLLLLLALQLLLQLFPGVVTSAAAVTVNNNRTFFYD
ncbi:hypothetical protein NHQ30_005163 [Ciborinia camelliae]|nr:hypothetical protein NHQ30_005163 [Ciborinia camelliae]